MSPGVWYDMGIREGKFRGVEPCTFLDTACHFFRMLREQLHKDLDPSYVTDLPESTFTFRGKEKNTAWENSGLRRWRYFSYTGNIPGKLTSPLGYPVPEKLWQSDAPQLEKVTFSEAEILGVPVIPHAFDNNLSAGGFLRTTLSWEKQRYALIQKMRYCIVPLKIHWYSDSDKEWYEYSGPGAGERGFVNSDRFVWTGRKYLRLTFPDFWMEEGTICKIALSAEKISGDKLPLEGARWLTSFPFTTQAPPEGEMWESASKLRIYGMADLSTHPGFASFFEF